MPTFSFFNGEKGETKMIHQFFESQNNSVMKTLIELIEVLIINYLAQKSIAGVGININSIES